MSSSQREITREVLHSVHDFLGGPTPDGDAWCFEFAEHLHSNWGAVYGGALGASTLAVARAAAPDRSPRSLHLTLRFTTAPAQREVLTASTILSVQNGTATVALEVQAGDNQLAARIGNFAAAALLVVGPAHTTADRCALEEHRRTLGWASEPAPERAFGATWREADQEAAART